MKTETLVSSVLSIVAALVVLPLAGFIGGLAWYAAGGRGPSAVVFLLIGGAASVFTVWKSGALFRKALTRMGLALPEPIRCGVLLGLAGAFLLGGGMLAGILILGHTRPSSWTFGNVVPAAGLGFLIFFIAGLPLRSRRQNANGTDH